MSTNSLIFAFIVSFHFGDKSGLGLLQKKGPPPRALEIKITNFF